MAHDNTQKKVLALDVRSRKFGFVVFEGPDKLLDWGVKSYAPQYGPLGETASRRISSLLELHRPSLMVLRLPSNRLMRRNNRIKTVLRTLRKEGRRQSVLMKVLRREKVKKFFMADGRTTKHQIASLLVERFPDLEWLLPSKRRVWECESYHMTTFDAASTGLAHFGPA